MKHRSISSLPCLKPFEGSLLIMESRPRSPAGHFISPWLGSCSPLQPVPSLWMSTHPSWQRLANCNLGAKSGPHRSDHQLRMAFIFVNGWLHIKLLYEYQHSVFSFASWGAKPKIFTVWPFTGSLLSPALHYHDTFSHTVSPNMPLLHSIVPSHKLFLCYLKCSFPTIAK